MKTKHESPRALALISVSDKRGIIEFATRLVALGYGLLSTGGTARALAAAGLPVTEVSDHTGSPEIMGGRVKTLHPKIHGGLLGRAGVDDAVMREQDIPRIDLAVINLYPFEAVTADADCTLEDAIENIDIGGPAMVRSAAKNFDAVGVVTSPDQYEAVLAKLEAGDGRLDRATRYELAVAAFNRLHEHVHRLVRFAQDRHRLPALLLQFHPHAVDPARDPLGIAVDFVDADAYAVEVAEQGLGFRVLVRVPGGERPGGMQQRRRARRGDRPPLGRRVRRAGRPGAGSPPSADRGRPRTAAPGPRG